MPLSLQDIQRIAQLGKLAFPAAESERLQGQINSFFELVEKMETVDTDGVEPLFHPVSTIQDITLRLHDDVADATDRREANMQNAPEAEDGLFLVPKVIE
ncbi:Asp-tRNA(Asn)/Glu-tRNA(Gln) amidotransferase subunit GatC [Corticibacter populi]|uniref:Aspartyl/glutamyl-tRNA(Asn/Gln) amidotransferase subunit C n=1 Tax=Corticibacter populi TaxID=1550736 RepID=A0A3M6QM64_9BURK|nr:Asp-tRNA(Asn)/Glu-tRNA(Gln) amidotransferase subunit GatC [Corticibacter populi]RMX04137.1 Asp-tRNA(Asn)/Glu-tRNA(Gln) amidotransferase subunit GatC [Corticibacter populi]RZS33150.1 aspartyl/glutamyl-tRNA(Asn/Gln) amidotransferase subunit C [Corticibacter populi]